MKIHENIKKYYYIMFTLIIGTMIGLSINEGRTEQLIKQAVENAVDTTQVDTEPTILEMAHAALSMNGECRRGWFYFCR